jgi:hypothetical protein
MRIVGGAVRRGAPRATATSPPSARGARATTAEGAHATKRARCNRSAFDGSAGAAPRVVDASLASPPPPPPPPRWAARVISVARASGPGRNELHSHGTRQVGQRMCAAEPTQTARSFVERRLAGPASKRSQITVQDTSLPLLRASTHQPDTMGYNTAYEGTLNLSKKSLKSKLETPLEKSGKVKFPHAAPCVTSRVAGGELGAHNYPGVDESSLRGFRARGSFGRGQLGSSSDS